MANISISGLPMIEEDEATPEIADLYKMLQREMDTPFVPNMEKALAIAPNVLAMQLDLYRTLNRHATLPQALSTMIMYCISTTKNCTYCSTGHELFCRTLGIDEETLTKLARDLGNVSPRRLQAIMQFAIKCALDPQGLVAQDYDRVRGYGVTDAELVEIIFWAAVANFGDTVADALKIEVDAPVVEALASM